MPEARKVTVLGVPLSAMDFSVPEDLAIDAVTESGLLVTFVNPLACSTARANTDYLQNLVKFDWVLCDGIGMVVAARIVESVRIQRTAFDLTSLAGPVCQWLAEKKLPVVLVGGKVGIAERAGRLLQELFPELRIVGTFGGYPDDLPAAREFIFGAAKPAVICGMGAPHQEQFLAGLKNAGWSGIGFTCGGFFDQLVDRIDYYPRWIDRYNLRFLFRLYKEPRRLWKRYLGEYQVFVGRFIKALIFR